jgi:hypothetical protein
MMCSSSSRRDNSVRDNGLIQFFSARNWRSSIQSLIDVSGQSNQPLKVEIKGFKTSHFLEHKTAPLNSPDAGSKGHVERPQSEPASNDTQFT